ncbi:glycosyltransferase family 4 protein [Acidobacteriota bacterium]
MKKILIFQRLMVHYRTGVFKALYKALGTILCYGRKGPSKTYLSKAIPDFPYITLKDIYLWPRHETFAFLDVFTPVRKHKPTVVITEFATLLMSNYLLLVLRPFFKYKLIIWSHIYNRKSGFSPKSSLSDWIRLRWMNKSDAVIVYGQRGKELLSPHLRQPGKLFVAPNTLDTPYLLGLRDRLREMGTTAVKTEIGFEKRYNLIFVGRLIQEKEPLRLLSIFSHISMHVEDVHLHIVGEGPLEKLLRERIAGSGLDHRVSLHGAVTDDPHLSRLLFASDLMVIPGYVGLSIVHAFCFDCPAVARRVGPEGPYHSPEIEYLKDGENGFLTDPDDDKAMADAVVRYLMNADAHLSFKKAAAHQVEHVCSLENMVRGFEDAVAYVLGK